MKCVTPLAGPDLQTARWGLRPLHTLPSGRSILESALQTRAWRGALRNEDYVFVVREVDGLQLLRTYLEATWPGCAVVTLPRLTGGGLLSALAGAALVNPDDVLCIDLADILFDGPGDFWSDWPVGVGAVTPCFISEDPGFSYLRSDQGRVVEAAEKRVISNNASAGVYFFRDSATFVEAAGHSLRNREALSYKGTLFVCPSMNGVLALGLEVSAPLVRSASPIGKLFHA